MLFFSNERNRKALITAYNELLNARDNCIGFTVEDPNTSNNPVETMHTMRSINAQFLEAQCLIGKKRLNITPFTGRGESRLVSGIIDDINKFKREYEKRTLNRSAYGILAPLAFCTRENLPNIMGTPELQDTFSMTWAVQFHELSSEPNHVGLFEHLGVNTDVVLNWWFEGKIERANETTDVWDDIKRFSLVLVYLFDEIVGSHFYGELAAKIHGLRSILTSLGTSLPRLIFLRPDYIDDIRQLLEVLFPPVYCFTLFMRTAQGQSAEAQKTSINFLDVYFSGIELERDALVSRLGVVKKMREYSVTDNQTWDRATHSQRTEIAELEASIKQQLVADLRSIGLPEISLNVSEDSQLGAGSFSKVYKCSTLDGSASYAVKVVVQKSSLLRTKERFLREVKRWKGLSHENINTLLGFTSFGHSFPGLISKVYESSLSDYISKGDANISVMSMLVIFGQIAEALRYLHEEKIMAHGDLRPANVLLDSRMTVKLTDFGVSRSEDSSAASTTNQKTNVAFLAPELRHNQPGLQQVSQKGDIFAFGCCFLNVFYANEMRTDTVEKLRRNKTKNGKVTKMPEVVRDIQPEHWIFLQRTWDEKPDRRPTVQELINTIQKFKFSS